MLFGAALLTAAVEYLASDHRMSMILGAVDGVATIIGLVLIVTRVDLSGRG